MFSAKSKPSCCKALVQYCLSNMGILLEEETWHSQKVKLFFISQMKFRLYVKEFSCFRRHRAIFCSQYLVGKMVINSIEEKAIAVAIQAWSFECIARKILDRRSSQITDCFLFRRRVQTYQMCFDYIKQHIKFKYRREKAWKSHKRHTLSKCFRKWQKCTNVH
jgi:hypothetical protein